MGGDLFRRHGSELTSLCFELCFRTKFKIQSTKITYLSALLLCRRERCRASFVPAALTKSRDRKRVVVAPAPSARPSFRAGDVRSTRFQQTPTENLCAADILPNRVVTGAVANPDGWRSEFQTDRKLRVRASSPTATRR